ncbi:hypothetical protein LC608_16950 [Nostoc sp. XA010]|uniref:hypothetical protein n=1 Tax=Nostoc sp. XA010 TaxID=2780407 RepID=UPI001E4D95D3|nr:hypothetical protein [Nostoc sp. XA010]MCC5658644.1 hypothetical protein [Nostoc sp. XA010]
MANNITNMTLRLPDDLNMQLQVASKTADVSKHQMIIDFIRAGLSGNVYQSLEAAQLVKEQLDSDRPITDVALDIQNALDMLQAQIHSLKEENKLIREELTKKKEEPEHNFKPNYEVTKQSTVRFYMLLASKYYEQEWGKGRNKDKYRYHYELGIVTRLGTTKTGRKSFWVCAVDLDDLQLSPDGEFMSPLGNYGYDPESWAKEEEEARLTSTRGKDPYKYQIGEDEELARDWQPGITSEYLHETFDIDYKELVNRTGLDLCIDGVWTRFIKQDASTWNRTGYVRKINYEAKVVEKKIEALKEQLGQSDKLSRESIKQEIKELEQKLQDLTYVQPVTPAIA